MEIVTKINEVKSLINNHKSAGKSIGFVPTMGALHAGHISLVRKAKAENDLCVVSIFVNPIQFNDKEDLKKYPRNFQKDLQLLEKEKCHILFSPSEAEIYPEPDKREFDLGKMAEILEAKHRPGHFQGVAKVVTKFFDIVGPNRAYFGQKDFQQLAIVKKITVDLGYDIEIVECPTLRENNGLAMSSRNELLKENIKKDCGVIYSSLIDISKHYQFETVEGLKAEAKEKIESVLPCKVEYVELVDSSNLSFIKGQIPKETDITACAAVKVDKVRLIDNIQFIS